MITIFAVGKAHEPHIKDAIALYESRLKRFCKLEWVLIPHAGNADVERLKTLESDAILAKIQPDDLVILLDERGQQWSSPEFAAKLEGWQATTRGRIIFIIGGAYGVDARVSKRADATWSLSKLVFPHQLVRVILLEQLYRGYAIIHKLPYHHE